MDANTLKKQLKQAPPAPIYLVLGTQTVIQDEVKEAFMALIPKEERVMNVGSYDLEEESLSAALDDAMSAPFFGERRLVIMNKPAFLTSSSKKARVKQNPDLLKQYLNHPQRSTVLVLMAPYEKLDGRKGVVRLLKKQAVLVDTAPLKEPQARQLIEQQARDDGYQFMAGAMDELVQRTNADYSLMKANLTKLELLCIDNHQIKKEAVAGLVPQTLDNNIFDLVSAVLKRQQDQALSLYRQLLDGEHQPLQINAVLVGQFRLLLQLKILSGRGLSQGTLAKKLNVHPYRVKLGLQTVRRFSLLDLINAYLGLIKTERALKGSSRSPELLFQLFMLQYQQKMNA